MADDHVITPTRRMPPETSAWIWISFFFLLFCTLVCLALIAGWRFYTTAFIPREASARIHVRAGVSYLPRNAPQPVLPTGRCGEPDSTCIPVLREEEQLLIASEAGYGPVASLLLPDNPTKPSQIDLWAHPYGAKLTMVRNRVSRWTSRLMEVVLRQDSGYARYDLQAGQPYDQVIFQVFVGPEVRIELQPGGSYSVNVPRDETGELVFARTQPRDAQPTLAEVAVRRGSARVVTPFGSREIQPGQRLAVDVVGRLASPQPAEWELIADGDFSRYTSNEYNQPSGTETWSINNSLGDQGMPREEQNGIFSTSLRCPPTKVDFCEQPDYVMIAQFRREGRQTRSYITGITQTLDVDVSEYRELHFSAWVRVLNQSVPLAGVRGSECPYMISIFYKETSPSDREQRYIRCIYSIEQPGDDDQMARSPEITYTPVAPFVWARLDIDLRKEPQLQAARYLQLIRIEARGHDYLSEFTDISLRGVQ